MSCCFSNNLSKLLNTYIICTLLRAGSDYNSLIKTYYQLIIDVTLISY